MKIFAVGDLHLSFDKNTDKPMKIFGEAWENHDERIKKDWESRVSKEDVVIIAGDISWALKSDQAYADLDWIHKLPGEKVLIKGNHDLWWHGIKTLNEKYEDMFFIQNTSYIVGKSKKIAICGSRGWICPGSEGFSEHDSKIFRRELMRIEASLEHARNRGCDEIICALHYPPTNDKLQESEITKLLERYGVKECIYGHLHDHEGFKKGLKGILNGVKYTLTSLDFLDCKLKLIYDF